MWANQHAGSVSQVIANSSHALTATCGDAGPYQRRADPGIVACAAI